MGDQPTLVKDSWHTAYLDGHEAGNHTQTHNTTVTTSLADWENEIDTCLSWLTKPFDPADLTQYATPVAAHGAGVKLEDIHGFRTPKLEYNDVPPDDLCEEYGVEPGLRDKLAARGLSASGKVTRACVW